MPPRPPQPRRPEPVCLVVAPSWKMPKPRLQRARHCVTLEHDGGPEGIVHPWDEPFCLAPISDDEDGSFHRGVIRAAPVPVLSEEKLRGQATGTGWMPSDGVLLEQHGMSAKHHFHKNERTSVVSRDWAHKTHARKADCEGWWTARASRATHAFGDIHFGITEAPSFQDQGRTLVFDSNGNARMGWHPLDLVHMFSAEDLERTPGVVVARPEEEPAQNADMNVTVEVDLANARLKVMYKNGCCVEYPIDGWETARLCATFSCPGDTLVMRRGPGERSLLQ